jgi:hypothetical protein
MAYYLSREREEDVAVAYKRYQAYLRENEQSFPPGGFTLGTELWYQNANDHRCPHDAGLENLIVSDVADASNVNGRITTIKIRLVNRYNDGHIELFYPRVFGYDLGGHAVEEGFGDWRYDEFTLTRSGHLLHEIEWRQGTREAGSRWLIEASDVKYSWLPKGTS